MSHIEARESKGTTRLGTDSAKNLASTWRVKASARRGVTRLLMSTVGCAIACLTAASQAAPLYYNALELPHVSNLYTDGQRLNDLGQVVGNLWGGSTYFSWSSTSGMTVWSGGVSLQDLNDTGVIVGSVAGTATQWVNGKAQTLSSDASGSAWYVNNNDWVVGSSPVNGWWLWRQNQGLLNMPVGFAPGAINDNGVIAGAFLGNGQVQSALWSIGTGLQLIAGTTPGHAGGLRAINNNGVFVGNDTTGSFMGTVAGDIYRLALPLGYTISSVLDINISNVAVGWASKDGQTQDLVMWDHGVAVIPTVHGAPVQLQSSSGLQINDQGQILDSVWGLNLQSTLLLTPCSRCGQIHPNPNPEGNAIVIDQTWEGAINAENFLNQGIISVSSHLENTYTGRLTTDSTGSIEMSAGRLRNNGVMSFSRRADGLASFAITGGTFEQADPAAYTLNSGLVTLQGGEMDINAGLWRNKSGARLQVQTGGSLYLGSDSWLDHAQGATLDIAAAGNLWMAGSAKLSNQGLIDVHGGHVSAFGTVINNSTGEIRVRGDAGTPSNWVMAGNLTNTGTITIADGGSLNILQTAVIGEGLLSATKGGAVTIAKGGTLWVAGTARLEAHDGDGGTAADRAFVNAGTFINSGTSVLDTLGSGSDLGDKTYNLGRLTVQHGGGAAGVGGGWDSFANYAGGYVEVGRLGGTLVNYGLMHLTGAQSTVAQDGNGNVSIRFNNTAAMGSSEMHVLSPMTNELNGILQINSGGQLWLGDQLTNAGGLVELGAGGTIDREPTSAGRVQVLQTAGLIRVDGSMTVDSFACQGGVVHGIGRITAPAGMTFGGSCTVAPGDSPGTLTLDGNASFDGTTFEMQVGSGVADQLVVTGRVLLQGGQVKLSFLDGAMPDPDDPTIALFKFSGCTDCASPDALPVTVVANSTGWQGSLATSQTTGQTMLSLVNPDALTLPDSFEVTTSYEVAAGSAVFQAGSATVDANASLINRGSFYNRVGASLVNSGLISNGTGGEMLNHGVVLNGGDFINEVGAWFNNRGEFSNVDAAAPARLINRGSFVNWQDGILRNGDEVAGLGGSIENQAGATFINRGLIINRGQVPAVGQSDPSSAQVQFVNRGVLENYGTIDNNGFLINEGGSLIVHAGGHIQGNDGIIIVRPGATSAGVPIPATLVVDGTLEARWVSMEPGTRLSGVGTVKADVFNQTNFNTGGTYTIAPGNGIGTLRIDGSVYPATFEIEVGNSTQFDHLVVSGSVYLYAINYVFGAEFVPHSGDHLTWLSASDVRNTDPFFASINYFQLDASGGSTLMYNGNSQIIDNKLYTLLNFGTVQMYAVAESSATGYGLDFLSQLPLPVPEPQSWQLMLGGVFALGVRLGWPRRTLRWQSAVPPRREHATEDHFE